MALCSSARRVLQCTISQRDNAPFQQHSALHQHRNSRELFIKGQSAGHRGNERACRAAVAPAPRHAPEHLCEPCGDVTVAAPPVAVCAPQESVRISEPPAGRVGRAQLEPTPVLCGWQGGCSTCGAGGLSGWPSPRPLLWLAALTAAWPAHPGPASGCAGACPPTPAQP